MFDKKCNLNIYRDAVIEAIKNTGRFNNVYVLNNTSDDIIKHNNMNGDGDKANVHIIINNGDIGEISKNEYGLIVELDIYIILVYVNKNEYIGNYYNNTNTKINEDITFLNQMMYSSDDILKLSRYRTIGTGFTNLTNKELLDNNLCGAMLAFTGKIKLI